MGKATSIFSVLLQAIIYMLKGEGPAAFQRMLLKCSRKALILQGSKIFSLLTWASKLDFYFKPLLPHLYTTLTQCAGTHLHDLPPPGAIILHQQSRKKKKSNSRIRQWRSCLPTWSKKLGHFSEWQKNAVQKVTWLRDLWSLISTTFHIAARSVTYHKQIIIIKNTQNPRRKAHIKHNFTRSN